ncbi:unnamed protein product [Closterium sp. NIES-53]
MRHQQHRQWCTRCNLAIIRSANGLACLCALCNILEWKFDPVTGGVGVEPAGNRSFVDAMWTTNKVFYKRNVHAARTGGAQELAIEGTPRTEIAELGHWALDKMTRAYITAIPVGVVMRKAGYLGAKQDYFLGRSRVEPSDKLKDIIAEHIFPDVDALLRRMLSGADNVLTSP